MKVSIFYNQNEIYSFLHFVWRNIRSKPPLRFQELIDFFSFILKFPELEEVLVGVYFKKSQFFLRRDARIHFVIGFKEN